jgi:hypothetical protein
MAQDYLRPAALKAGILTEGDRRRFGFHNLRQLLGILPSHTDIKTNYGWCDLELVKARSTQEFAAASVPVQACAVRNIF